MLHLARLEGRSVSCSGCPWEEGVSDALICTNHGCLGQGGDRKDGHLQQEASCLPCLKSHSLAPPHRHSDLRQGLRQVLPAGAHAGRTRGRTRPTPTNADVVLGLRDSIPVMFLQRLLRAFVLVLAFFSHVKGGASLGRVQGLECLVGWLSESMVGMED